MDKFKIIAGIIAAIVILYFAFYLIFFFFLAMLAIVAMYILMDIKNTLWNKLKGFFSKAKYEAGETFELVKEMFEDKDKTSEKAHLIVAINAHRDCMVGLRKHIGRGRIPDDLQLKMEFANSCYAKLKL